LTEFERTPSQLPSGSASTARSSPGSDRRAEKIHDFAGKLQQPSLWPHVVDYVKWQRALRAARAQGRPEPAVPELAPISINLDLTTACNYACDHCIDWDILNSKVRHEDDALRASLQAMQARGLKSVILIGGGEPTLYPGFPQMVEFLKGMGLQVAVVSNGSRNDKIFQATPFFGKGDWVRLSLDAGSNDVWRRMHNPSSKTLTLDEICSWGPKIKALNPTFDFGFSFVITWKGGSRGAVKVVENIHEIEMAAERAAKSGFDYISFKPFLERQEDGAEVLDPQKVEAELQQVVSRIRTAIDAARRFERPGFRVLESTNLRVLMAGNWQDYTRQPRTCHMQLLRQVQTPLGTFNCPAHRGVAKARIADANAYKDEASAQQTGQQLLKILDNFDASHECREVTCLYNGVNWWIEKLVANPDQSLEAEIGEERLDWFL
jgi:sulfatase maturation enzyme AslB (radical SAM superfamily)